MTGIPPEKMAKFVKKCLEDEKYFKEDVTLDTDEFRYVAIVGKITIEVFQEKNTDCLVIGCTTNLSDGSCIVLFDPKPPNFMVIEQEAMRNGAQFVANPEKKIATVADIIYSDGLTKHELYRTVNRVVSARTAFITSIRLLAGPSTPIKFDESEDDHNPMHQ